jgi:hypothetical protein
VSAYADTSLLVSLYTPDSNSGEASAVFGETKDLILITPFGESEFVNAVELRVFRKEISSVQADKSLQAFEGDLDAGSFVVRRAVPVDAYGRAVLLSRRHTRQMGVRGLDVIHVAIAVEAHAEIFLTFDKNQANLARRAGLSVRPRR